MEPVRLLEALASRETERCDKTLLHISGREKVSQSIHGESH